MATVQELRRMASSNSVPEVSQRYERGERNGQTTHTWSIQTALGGIHLHITDGRQPPSDTVSRVDSASRVYGGIEVHYANPPKGREFDAPAHSGCRFSGGNCWREDTSLGADSITRVFKDLPQLSDSEPQQVAIANHQEFFDAIRHFGVGRILPPFEEETE